MFNARTFCREKESAAAGKWFVCPHCVGRLSPPRALCESRAESGFAPPAGARSPGAAVPFRRNIRGASDSAKRRDAVSAEYNDRCDPLFVRKDIFAARPRMVDLRRATPVAVRSAPLRVEKHVTPANTSRLGDVLGQVSEVPSDGTSLSSVSAQMCGPRARAERVTLESVDRIRHRRAPHAKYEYVPSPWVARWSISVALRWKRALWWPAR